jgi:DNA topoisomerase-3
VKHLHNDREVEFTWERNRLFDYNACRALYNHVVADPTARVIDIKTKPKSKWRPTPLDTIELEKSASRKLRINAKETMKIAENLYTKGFISYPRTETNIFPKGLLFSILIGIFLSQILFEFENIQIKI